MRNVLIFAAIAFIALGLAWSAPQPADAATEQVEIGDFYFCAPPFESGVCTTTITAGDTVTWEVALGVHTVSECNATYTTCSDGFDSGLLLAGETFTQTFATAGSYFYNCAVHPTLQQGVVVVVAAATDAPTQLPGTATPTPTPTPSQPAEPGVFPPTGDGSAIAAGSLLGLLLIVGGGTFVIGVGLLGFAVRRRPA